MSKHTRKRLPDQSDTCNTSEIGYIKPNLITIIVLILILLKFGDNGSAAGEEDNNSGETAEIDNGILFIIALFYLFCCNSCK